MSSEATSRKFASLIKSGKVSAGVKLLYSEMSGGIRPLNDKTFHLLQTIYLEPNPCHPHAVCNTKTPKVHPVVFNTITANAIGSAAMDTKGGSVPSRQDADSWRQILTVQRFGVCSEELRTELALPPNRYAQRKLKSTIQWESVPHPPLIPLYKNPRLRPIGVGEVFQRIVGKVVMKVSRLDVQKAAGSLQVCAGQLGGGEAAVHAMRDIFEEDDCYLSRCC